MSDRAMREVYQLIEEERYREAREILETEKIDPAVREKWLTWLHELHREDRVQAGVMSDKAKANRLRAEAAFAEVWGFVVATALVIVIGFAVALYAAFALTNPSPLFSGLLLAAGLVFGHIGWQHIANTISTDHGMLISSIVVVMLTVYLLTSGVPFFYYYEVPLNHTLTAFALIFPGAGTLAWQPGYKIGAVIARLIQWLT